MVFSPEGYRFYLPAYLIASLDWDESQNIGPSILRGLAPPPYGVGSLEDFVSRVEGLTPQQHEAVRVFLHYLNDHYSDVFEVEDNLPLRALKEYWEKSHAAR